MPLKRFEKEALLFLGRHLVYGLAAGFTFGAALLYFDIAQIRTLAFNSQNTVLILILLFFGLFVTFGSVAMGVGIMSLGEDEN